MTFVLDWTAPNCTLTGIERQIYEAESLTAYLTPYDNTELSTVKVYLDSELLMEKKAGKISDDTVEIPLKASDNWQTLQVYLCDMAGNEFWTDEVPFYLCGDTKQVPEYVKTKPSAREKVLQQTNIPDKNQAGMELAPERAMEENTRMAGISSKAVSNNNLPLTGKIEGVVLLALGILMFLSTVTAYVLSGVRKKN